MTLAFAVAARHARSAARRCAEAGDLRAAELYRDIACARARAAAWRREAARGWGVHVG